MRDVVRATDLYLLAVCPHRIHLDRRGPSSEAADPSEATKLLMARGLAHEKDYSERLGWPSPEYPAGDFERGAEATLELMQQGVAGICQGVLREGRHLAIPDLLERATGPSRLGDFHYRPGDIKAGLEPRADQALQVAFAAHLLNDIQGVYPAEGYLILGDGRRNDFSLLDLRELLASALQRVESILDGIERSESFLCHACASCPWRNHCLPAFQSEDDLCLVDGMTPTRRRVLRREGISNVQELASLDLTQWREEERPPLALDRLIPQAEALRHGELRSARKIVEVPAGAEHAILFHAERDPMSGGEVSFLAWARYAPSLASSLVTDTEASLVSVHIEVLLNATQRREAMLHLSQVIEETRSPLLHFGSQASRALGLLSDAAGLTPEAQAGIEGKLFNLLLSIRRAAAYLPVRRYEIDEVAAILRGTPPGITPTGDPALFVFLEQLRQGSPGPWEQKIQEFGTKRLGQLRDILAWLLSHPTREPRRAHPR